MPIRTTWEDLYSIEQTASLTAKPTFAATAIGMEGDGSAGGKFLMPLTDHPHLKPTSATQETELAVGLSQRVALEYNQTIAEPSTVTINMLANSYNLSLFLWLLFQSGAAETGTPVLTMECIPYIVPTIEVYAAITRILGGTAGDADTVSQYMPGCICRSITLSGETGGLITLSAEMIGATWAVANDDLGTETWTSLTFSNIAPLKFQDAAFTLDSNTVETPAFSITISNNAVAQFYNNSTIQRYIMGRLTMEGNFAIPWSVATEGGNTAINDFIAGNVMDMELYWGSLAATAASELSFAGPARYTDTDMGDTEGEINTAINFAGLQDSSAADWSIKAGYTLSILDRGVA